MQIIVGVLRGGPSREHEVSLQSGTTMLRHLPEDKFIPRDIYIDKKGQWHDRGRVVAPERVLRQLDVVLLGLHGEYGEDGQIQRLLEQFGVPFSGADSFGSYLAMHKVLSKARAKEIGLNVPDFHFIERPDDVETGAAEVIRRFHQPVVVKPVAWGSSVGVSIVGGHAPVLAAIKKLFAEGSPGVLIEELIRGREATAGVVEGLRGEPLYALPPVEIVPPSDDFFSYDAKYSGKSREIVPAKFSRTATEDLMHAAKAIHRALGLRHYSRSDFIVTPKGIYYLETNTLPGLTSESLLPKSLNAVGVSLREFLDHLINLALSRA